MDEQAKELATRVVFARGWQSATRRLEEARLLSMMADELRDRSGRSESITTKH
jgi:hypothetical protein